MRYYQPGQLNITQRISLPKLESIFVYEERFLGIFTGLISLKQIYVTHWSQFINIDDIFDPEKIFYLKVNGAIKSETLRLFTNLRSLDF